MMALRDMTGPHALSVTLNVSQSTLHERKHSTRISEQPTKHFNEDQHATKMAHSEEGAGNITMLFSAKVKAIVQFGTSVHKKPVLDKTYTTRCLAF